MFVCSQASHILETPLCRVEESAVEVQQDRFNVVVGRGEEHGVHVKLQHATVQEKADVSLNA